MKNFKVFMAVLVFVLVSVLVFAAVNFQSLSPEDGVYDLDGRDIIFNVSVCPSGGQNITDIDLYTSNNSWGSDGSASYSGAGLTGTCRTVGFVLASSSGSGGISDGTDLIWSFGVTENGSSVQFSSNRTVNVEFPPDIDINSPASNSWQSSNSFDLNFTPTSLFYDIAGAEVFSCDVWSNHSGSWQFLTGGINAPNGTHTVQGITLDDSVGTAVNVRCHDGNDGNVVNSSVNVTYNVDATDPVVALTVEPYQDGSVVVYVVGTDTNLNNLYLDANFSGSYTVNETSSSPTSGSNATFSIPGTVGDGVYVVSARANDSAGNVVSSSNLSVTVDTVAPQLSSFANSSISGHCQARKFTWSNSEESTVDVYVDTDTDTSDGDSSSNSSFESGGALSFVFGQDQARTHYVNVTRCDRAGNCNSSPQITWNSPNSVCNGWSQWTVFDSSIRLVNISAASGADSVYFFNQTSQEWVAFVSGLSANANVNVGYNTGYNVVHLSASSNSTWYRTVANNGVVDVNLTVGNNWLPVNRLYSLGNFSESLMNGSVQFPSQMHRDADSAFVFNFSFVAGFNNSIQDYASHLYNFSWGNASMVEPCIPGRSSFDTCMEAVWVGGNFNVTWNGYNVTSNWTKA